MRAGDVLAAIRSLPIASLDDLREVLVLAPHPDDESLGCGGVIGSLCDDGRCPAIVFVTDGAKSHPGSVSFPPELLRQVRQREALEAASILGVRRQRVRFLGLPDGSAPSEGNVFAEAVGWIVRAAAEFGCSTVLASWGRDPHCDHQAAHAMARATGLRVLSYPVWGWLLPDEIELADEPGPVGFRLPVASQIERKRRAIAAHRSQIGGLIEDDPSGFRLPRELLDACTTPFEFFLEQPR